MRSNIRIFGMLAVIVALTTAGSAGAQDNPQKITGTIEFHELQVAYIGSGTMGHGTLYFQGQSYPIKVAGLGIGGIGLSTIQAHGDVYDLENIEDFPGLYGQARYGIAVGDMSSGEMWLANPNGITIHLDTKREGLMLSLGGDGLDIEMDE
jgi:hypothetical protein